jgi:hypothetical protein
MQVTSTRTKQNSSLARRMMFIILTDFFCWFPVIIISILALTGNLYDPTKQVYPWVAVFVLPINSSINPLLYTFSTPYVGKNVTVVIEALSGMIRRIRVEGILFKKLFKFHIFSSATYECNSRIAPAQYFCLRLFPMWWTWSNDYQGNVKLCTSTETIIYLSVGYYLFTFVRMIKSPTISC